MVMNGEKTAIVTGSTSGIGLGIAQAVARAGNNIVINGFGNVDEIKAITADLQTQAGVQVEYSNADMSRPGQISKMVQENQRRFPPVDILVKNAGIHVLAPVDEFPDRHWSATLA